MNWINQIATNYETSEAAAAKTDEDLLKHFPLSYLKENLNRFEEIDMLFNLTECIPSHIVLYISLENDKLLQLTETDSWLIKNIITCT